MWQHGYEISHKSLPFFFSVAAQLVPVMKYYSSIHNNANANKKKCYYAQNHNDIMITLKYSVSLPRFSGKIKQIRFIKWENVSNG